MSEPAPIEVVAVVLVDPADRVLTVRKQGTRRFMLVGGKPERGETARTAAVRETREEVGLVVAEEALTELGVWRGAAANEVGHPLVATLFGLTGPVDPAEVAAAGEIAQTRWLDPTDPQERTDDLAPLLTEHVLPMLREPVAGRRIAVFCGSRHGGDARWTGLAREVGATLAAAGVGLVYGGGNVGLMGEVADAAMAGGGEVIGVIPHGLVRAEQGHEGTTRLEVVESMHERKQRMADLSDAFVALPGGVGTLEELFEVVTWAQLGIHAKPVGVLDLDGFWDPLRHLLSHLHEAGFLDVRTLSLVQELNDPAEMLALVGARLQA